MASRADEDGFHEIQLNGKQLVFLFMAATVVSVVIFLCGVLVGRGVRAERAIAPETVSAEAPAPDAASPDAVPATAPAGSDPRQAAPPPEANDLTYFKRLEDEKEPVEALKSAGKTAQVPKTAPPANTAAAAPPAEPAKIAPAAPKPPAEAPPKNAKAAAATVPSAAPGPGYAVQVAALNARSEADSVARRLSDKGYSAYVLAPANGTPRVYRVRVGTFKTRREAEGMAARLQKEEQFKPWVTR